MGKRGPRTNRNLNDPFDMIPARRSTKKKLEKSKGDRSWDKYLRDNARAAKLIGFGTKKSKKLFSDI